MKTSLKIFLIGLISYGVLFWASLAFVGSKVEVSLKQKVQAELVNYDEVCEDIKYDFSGRDCSVSGTIYDEIDREKIIEAIKSVSGVRKVSDELQLMILALPELRIEKSGEPNNLIWKIKGIINDGPDALELQEVLGKTLGDNNKRHLSIELKKDSGTADSLPVKKIGSLLSQILEILPEITVVELSDKKLKLTAETFSQERHDKVLAFAESHLADEVDGIIDGVVILEPTDNPKFSISVNDGEELIVSGLLANDSLKNRIIDLIKQTNEKLNLQDKVQVGEHVRDAEWSNSIVRIIPALVAEVNNLQLNVSSESVEFSGTVLGDDKKDSIQALAAQSFNGKKGSFKLINELVVFVPPDKANLTMSLSEEGGLKLTGLLPRQEIYDQFIKEAGSIFKEDDGINEKIEVKENVEEAPWIGDMSRLVSPFLSSVQWGALSVHGDEVALEAEVSNPESGDVLQAIVEKSFPLDAYKRVIQITVAEPTAPSDEDIMALEELVTDTVIYFLTESHSLGSKDKTKLDGLAEAFLKVPGSSLALLGHTDPYGNADYNRKLSRKRCESVRDYLIDLGINTLLLEIVEKGETDKVVQGRTYESGRRVEFELR